MKRAVLAALVVLSALVLPASAQPRLAPPVKDLPRAPRVPDPAWCDVAALGLAARDLIGPHDDPIAVPDQPPCQGRVCDAWGAMVRAHARAKEAATEYRRIRALDDAAKACGF